LHFTVLHLTTEWKLSTEPAVSSRWSSRLTAAWENAGCRIRECPQGWWLECFRAASTWTKIGPRFLEPGCCYPLCGMFPKWNDSVVKCSAACDEFPSPS